MVSSRKKKFSARTLLDHMLKEFQEPKNSCIRSSFTRCGVGCLQYKLTLDGSLRIMEKAPLTAVSETYPDYDKKVGIEWMAATKFWGNRMESSLLMFVNKENP